MRKKIIIYFSLAFGLLIITNLAAQISQGGEPLSFTQTQGISLDYPSIKMPALDIQGLRYEDSILDQYKDIPWRFGENIEVHINNLEHGLWETLTDGTRLWRVGIHSPEALSINLLFDRYLMPPGATLFIYTEDKSQVIGAFTDFNNQPDSLLATTLVFGDKIIVEYIEPPSVAFTADLSISRVTHGYRSAGDFMKAFGQAGSCNVNVACPQSAGWENQIRSVCMLVTGGSGFCSGALINNTANDGKPYVLSANHCYSNPSSVVFWFNWQSATCSNPPSSPPYNSMSGGVLRARNTASDFWLIELNNAIPPSYNAYFSGWNRTLDNNISGTVFGIHHPRGDIKKISWSTTGVSTTTYLQNTIPGDGTHWRVTTWSDGTTTEGGSSGSPIYDPNKRIVGQLHGGYASCTSITSDWYGKLGVSWTGGGSNATRLSNWLDPLGTNPLILDGYDPNQAQYGLDLQMQEIVVPEFTYCNVNAIQPQVTIRNAGTQTITSAVVSYTLNAVNPVTIPWSGTLAAGQTTLVVFPEIMISPGTYQFIATVSSPNGGIDENPANDQLTKNFTITDTQLPFFEGFEGGILPSCWTQETGPPLWVIAQGNGSSNPPNAYSGSYNALLKDNTAASDRNKLITPPLDFTGYTNAVLTFWHVQQYWSPDQDELRIYYKTHAAGSWNLIATYTQNISSWTQQTLALPNTSSTYYIAFEGDARYGYGVGIDDISIDAEPTAIEVDIHILLEGAFNNGTIPLMRTNINPIVPLQHPFNPPLPYYGNPDPQWYYQGNEGVASMPAGVVDWVLIELRDALTANVATEATMIAKQAALLLNTGQVVSVSGQPLQFETTITNQLFVVVHHRNHLSAMSSGSVPLVNGIYTWNFMTAANMAYNEGQKNLGNAYFGLYGGDGDASGQIQNQDKNDVWAIQSGMSGYLPGDYDMNGQVQNQDKNEIWSTNSGKGSAVP